MAYPTYQPNMYYPSMYYPQTQSIQQNIGMQNTQPQQMAQATPQLANNFIVVRSEEEARNYPIAPGNVITFKDENAPYMYEKTMGFSQFDRPTFEKWRLTKEDVIVEEQQVKASSKTEYATIQDLNKLNNNFINLQSRIDRLEESKVASAEEVQDDE